MNAFSTKLIGSLVVAGTLALIGTGAAKAEPRHSRGIICLTQSAEESVFAFADAITEASMDEAIAATNKIRGVEDCAFKAIVFEDGDKVADAQRAEMQVEVHRITILAECGSGFCVSTEPTIAFAAFAAPPQTSSI
jgi:hypothetical protein